MRHHWFLRAVSIVLLAVAMLGVLAFVVMILWNWLMPALFGWKEIGYWQALGLLVMINIIFVESRVKRIDRG